MEVLRECLDNQMTNLQIAQLNDCAYKAIRKAGVQKKLDERAIKNEAYFKMNEEKLDKLASGLNVEKIRNYQKDIIAEIGTCPMSLCDVVELMEKKDCMCLSLQISRSEATILDPSKLIIQGIVPTYMSLDSFLDSSIYNLQKN